MAGNIIRRFVIKQLSKDRGSGIMEIPNRYMVDQRQLSLQNYLIQKGVNPNSIKTEGQLNTILQQIEKNRIATGLKKAEAQKRIAEIMDMKGRKINPKSRIMGGQQAETEKEIAERLKRQNKETVDRIKKDKDFDFDQDPEFASGGRAGKYQMDLPFGKPLFTMVMNNKLYGIYQNKDGSRLSVPLGSDGKPNYAQGGRAGLSYLLAEDGNERMPYVSGGGVNRLRRLFLKMLGAGAATTAAVKSGILSFGGKKSAAKKVAKEIIKTDNVAGKPEWFDALVTRVINEGDDVTKNFATKEREIIHKKKITEDDTVTVTQDLDEGIVRVEYDSPENMYGDPVSLQYKKPLPDESNPRPKAEFDTAESGPVGRADGPDDYSIDIDEVGGTSIKDLTSDVSKLKEFATKKKLTMKEFIESKKRKDRAKAVSEGGENEMDEVIRRQGEYIENDLVDLDPSDYAEGGRAKMYLGGGLLQGKGFLRKLLKNLAKDRDEKASFMMRVINPKSYQKALEDAKGSGMYDRRTGILQSEKIKNIIDDVKKSRVEQLERYKGMAESSKEKAKNLSDLKKAAKEAGATDEIAESMANSLDKMFDGPIPKGATDETILELEQMIKNMTLRNTNRLTNANGGIARLLGE